MLVRLGSLRRYIREHLQHLREQGQEPEGQAKPTRPNPVGGDPKHDMVADYQRGFYPYEIERGTDVHSFWYRSPGRSAGEDGDPFRPSDAHAYLGMHVASDADAQTPPADLGDEGTAARSEVELGGDAGRDRGESHPGPSGSADGEAGKGEGADD